MSDILFEFVRDGRPVPDSETQCYLFGDYFDCDIRFPTPDDLSTYYKGPDCEGIGVRWTIT